MLTWIDKIGTKSFTVAEEVRQSGRVCARGTATYVYFNYETQSAEVIPDAVRTALDAHVKSPPVL